MDSRNPNIKKKTKQSLTIIFRVSRIIKKPKLYYVGTGVLNVAGQRDPNAPRGDSRNYVTQQFPTG